MSNNNALPQPTHDETGRAIASTHHTAGGTLIWFNDGRLPVVRHVVAGQINLEHKS